MSVLCFRAQTNLRLDRFSDMLHSPPSYLVYKAYGDSSIYSRG